MMKYVCTVCGWVYDEDEAGVKWEDLPEDFACELCGVGKDMFEPEA
ncbi:MAG: rubredoxin [Desulfovibrio sp.]|nr:rubredoxin [Desulfovibrio sp.]